MVKKNEEEKEKKKSLIERIKKASTIEDSDILSHSKFFKEKDYVSTSIPAINIALSGEVDGGLSAGSFVLAAPSRHFKSMFALLFASAYFDKYGEEAALLFYDSEFGTPLSYFDAFEIDKDRILHTPLTNLEEFRFDIMNQLKNIDRGDKLIAIVDSLGNLASIKEVEDALEEKSTEDMTRARKIKGLFRMVTSHLTIKNIPLITINHVYMTLEKYARAVISGGTGIMLAADNAWIIGRQQNKETSGADKGDLLGYDFVINIEKSRHVKEKSRIFITVTHEGGIAKWSGMEEMAIDAGFVKKIAGGSKGDMLEWANPETGEVKTTKVKNNQTNDDFWRDLVYSERFKQYVRDTFKLGQIKMIGSDLDDIDDEDDDGELVE